nr:hypothetical protein [Synechococcus sp. UW140]
MMSVEKGLGIDFRVSETESAGFAMTDNMQCLNWGAFVLSLAQNIRNGL